MGLREGRIRPICLNTRAVSGFVARYIALRIPMIERLP
jgi:hypothetical protein